MVRPSAQSREGLIPRLIVDVNGNPKRVWVRPDDESYAAKNPIHEYAPQIRNQMEEDIKVPTHDRIGERQGSLRDTREEKTRAFERGYGSDRLHAAAARKFEADFGVSVDNAPDYDLTNEQLYDYIARGLSMEKAQEFAFFGIEPHLTHPKLDAEYSFVAGPKVTKIDLRKQMESDSHLRKEEFKDIKTTARFLQDMEVEPAVAAQCLANGLRMKHLKDKTREIRDTIKLSHQHNVESDAFENESEKLRNSGPTPAQGNGFQRWAKEQGVRARRAVWRGVKRWARTRMRRIYNGVRRRIFRFLKLAFLPWKTR